MHLLTASPHLAHATHKGPWDSGPSAVAPCWAQWLQAQAPSFCNLQALRWCLHQGDICVFSVGVVNASRSLMHTIGHKNWWHVDCLRNSPQGLLFSFDITSSTHIMMLRSSPQASTSSSCQGAAAIHDFVFRRAHPRRHRTHLQPVYTVPTEQEHRKPERVPLVKCRAVPNGDREKLPDQDVMELEAFLRIFKERREGQQAAVEGPGDVYLVGTGPGDPGLLTLRAVQLMQSADVVLYDRLVSDDILRLVGSQARMVYVGKHSGFHTRSQEEIHQLLLAFAEAGATVIRLKGGDPYVFGRGGEEVQYLSARGIQVHCVPGITAASGICAELGIPMTHRGVATSVRFLTGHSREGGEEQLDATISLAADPNTTLVVYMGLQKLPTLQQQLCHHGLGADTPAVAVERGTTPKQRIVFAPLSQLPERAQEAGLKSPTLIIVGEVVALAPGWQGWEASGRPLVWKGADVSYGLPAFESHQLSFLGSVLGGAGSSGASDVEREYIEARPVPGNLPVVASSMRAGAAGRPLQVQR